MTAAVVAGATTIVAVDVHDNRLELARAWGDPRDQGCTDDLHAIDQAERDITDGTTIKAILLPSAA